MSVRIAADASRGRGGARVFGSHARAGSAGRAARDAPLYSVGTYDQTLPFYWRRTFELVAYRGELDYGLRHDPRAEMAGVEEFVERWSRETAAYAVMENSMFNELTRRGVPMRTVASDVNRVLVSRR